MQTEVYKVNYIISGIQYKGNGYGEFMWKNGNTAGRNISKLSKKEKEDLFTEAFRDEQESYVSIRSRNAINDIMDAITKHHENSGFVECKIQFTSVSVQHNLNFIIEDGKCIKGYKNE